MSSSFCSSFCSSFGSLAFVVAITAKFFLETRRTTILEMQYTSRNSLEIVAQEVFQ